MIGIMKNSIPGYESMDAEASLAAARGLGLGGVMFGSILDISPTLDAAVLARVRETAARLDMRLAAGFSMFNPSRPDRVAPYVALGDGDLAAGMTRIVAAAAALGLDALFFVVGTIADRDDPALPWADQLASVADFLSGFAPVLRAHGVRLLIKTHEEITTFEIIRLIETVGADVLGVAHDPVNVVCRLEDPVAATRRIAGHVVQMHLDDSVLRFEAGGMRRYLAPLGEGSMDWPAMRALVPDASCWIELHRGQFAMPVFDPVWLAAQSDLTLADYAAVLATAAAYGSREIPCDQTKPLDRLGAALAHLGVTA